jgi:transposase-like protein
VGSPNGGSPEKLEFNRATVWRQLAAAKAATPCTGPPEDSAAFHTPTHFGNCLKEMLVEKKTNALQLHEATGINHSILSRLMSGYQPWVGGEIEADECYFGGRRKGQRGRGAAGKVHVFGLLERGGRVCNMVVPDCTKETLMAKIRAHSVKGSVYYTDEFGGYNDLKSHGKHLSVNHQVAFKNGSSHINGIEGFWSFAKGWHRQTHGVDPDNFPLCLREHEFRFNHRNEDLLDLLYRLAILPKLTLIP